MNSSEKKRTDQEYYELGHQWDMGLEKKCHYGEEWLGRLESND